MNKFLVYQIWIDDDIVVAVPSNSLLAYPEGSGLAWKWNVSYAKLSLRPLVPLTFFIWILN